MPEGPELHMSSNYVNFVCKGRVFGRIYRWPNHKCGDIPWTVLKYAITSVSRGKEMQLVLTPVDDKIPVGDDQKYSKARNKKAAVSKPADALRITFQYGMSGQFKYYQAQSEDDLLKHAHLNFFTADHLDPMVLSFVDTRRFGKWRVDSNWSSDRGPCTLLEYPAFRTNVLSNLQDSAFNKPICEVLLNQKYFNGIGNYLRAEILYRAKIRPFEQARSVLEPLLESLEEKDDKTVKKVKIKQEGPDILQLCNLIPLEVVSLGCSGYLFSDDNYQTFSQWLQCYYNPSMRNMLDHNKRTIWFHGDPGPLVPKEVKVRRIKKTSAVYKNKMAQKEEDGSAERDANPTGKKRVTKPRKKTSNKDSLPSSAKNRKKKEVSSKPKTAKASRKKDTASSVIGSTDTSGESTPTSQKQLANGRKRRAAAAVNSKDQVEVRRPAAKQRKTSARKSAEQGVRVKKETELAVANGLEELTETKVGRKVATKRRGKKR